MAGAQPAIAFEGVRKAYGAASPLAIDALTVGARDRVSLTGIDAGAAEMVMHLVTGAAVPDEGRVVVFGTDTRAIATDTEWLTSLDRFGLVSNRAVLLDQSTVADNLALPLTLSIDPMPDDVRRTVEALAADVALAPARLAEPAGVLTPAERMRLHLARALAGRPSVLLLEHPTVTLPADARAGFGRLVAAVAERHHLAWLNISNDDAYLGALGGVRRGLGPGWLEVARQRFGRWMGAR